MMRPLDSREWLEAQRVVALAAGDHASFDHATALLDRDGEYDRLAELAGIVQDGAYADAYSDPLLQRATYLADVEEMLRHVLVDAGVLGELELTDNITAPRLRGLLEMFLPGVA
jgi:hypothetical protein